MKYADVFFEALVKAATARDEISKTIPGSGTSLWPEPDGSYALYHKGKRYKLSKKQALQHFPELADASRA